MSFALITTLYGLALAMKMERHTHHQIMGMNLILKGTMLLHQRRHCYPLLH